MGLEWHPALLGMDALIEECETFGEPRQLAGNMRQAASPHPRGTRRTMPESPIEKSVAMSTTHHAPATVFISYSHKDRRWLERLQVHLKPLIRAGQIDLWDDTRIRPGDQWRQEIERALDAAGIAVMLVSADFLASDFIHNQEIPALLQAAEQRGTRILPVILSHCLFSDSSLGRFQAVNPPDKPLAGLPEQERVLRDLALAIRDKLSGEAPARGSVSTATRSRAEREQGGTDNSLDGRTLSPSGDPPATALPSTQQSLGTWLFGGLLLVFVIGVFMFAPPELPDYKQRILALCAALLAGLFGWFLSGEIGLRINALKSRFGDIVVRAGGGLALFVLVLLWWLSPMAPVESAAPTDGGTVVGTAVELQVVAGRIRAAETGEPVADAQVSIAESDLTTTTDHLGRFEFELSARLGAAVELSVTAAGYAPYSEYIAAGTTGLGIQLRKPQP